MSVYEQEIASLLGPLVAALAEEAPAQPADYPADDDEAIIIIEGLLEIVRAFVSETATSCNELRRVQQEWSAEVKRKKAGERLTADTEYERVMNDQNFDDVMMRAKARQKALVVLESELNVRMKRCRLRTSERLLRTRRRARRIGTSEGDRGDPPWPL
jgi:hypothetical protein